MTVLSWKTLVVGAAMVAFASLFEFDKIGNQIEMFRALRRCRIQYGAVNVDAIARAMREFSKHVHSEAQNASRTGICTSEETNAIRDDLRKHGTSKIAWVLYKFGVPPQHAENAIMISAAVSGASMWGLLTSIRTGRMPWRRCLLLLGIAQQGDGAVPYERQLMKKLKHAEFIYGTPPCASYCGKVPSQCTVTGWVYKDVYIFRYDDADRVCKHFKASTPTDTAASWSRSAFWGGAARFIYNLGDGFQPEDVLSLASGYWSSSTAARC